MDDLELDTRGLTCPLPVLKAQKALKTLAAGARLIVLATDPKAAADFAQLCETVGHRLVETRQDGSHMVLVIEKRA